MTSLTKWVEVPWVVRDAVEALIKASGDDADPSGYTGVPGLTHMADVLGWKDGPINAYWGGPRPLANLLIGSALGAGTGFLGGAIAERVTPAGVFRPGALRKRLALLGAAIGAAPGAMQSIDNVSRGLGVTDTWRGVQDPSMAKESVDLFAPAIPANVFAAQIMADPFAPPHLMAASAGVVQAASAMTGSPIVSPWDVARVAMSTGSGAASGIILGRTLGVLAGLTPQAQRQLQTTGWWAGLLNATVPRALSLR